MGKSSRSRRKQRKHYQNASSSQSNAKASASSNESDIPGYYYDEEQKRYFKILPNSMTSAGSFVTKETVKKNKAECRRLLDREKAATGSEKCSSISSSSSSSSSQHNKNKLAKHFAIQPLLNVLKSMQCGQYTCQSVHRYTLSQRCQKLKPQPGWETGQNATFVSSIVSPGDIQKLEITADCDKAVAVWSQKGIILQWMQLVNLSTTNNGHKASSIGRHLDLSILDPGDCVGSSLNKVTSLCWSPLSQVPGKTCVLYTTMCPVGYSGSQVSIFNLEASSGQEAHMFSFDLGRHSVWSCAWNRHRSRFSVGCERKTHVIDVHSRCKWTYSHQNSDSLAQLFSHSNPHILYAGTRSGYVLILDMRAPNNSSTSFSKFNHKHSVVCLRSLRDENYLMASDYSGLIRTWDLRFQKTVKKYAGLVNTHYQLPFYLDDTEKFVYATGSDGYCKVWDAKDEFLLKSIAPPLPVHSADSFPVSHLSEKWGGLNGNFGLVTAMANKFFLYS